MIDLIYSEFSSTLGITLLHSLWQAGLALLLVLVLSRAMRKQKAALRYWLNVSVLGLFLLINIASYFFINPSVISVLSENNIENSGIITSNIWPAENIVEKISAVQLNTLVPYFMIFWVLGLIVLSIRMGYHLYQIHLLKTRNLEPISDKINRQLENLLQRFNLTKKVSIALSSRVLTPTVLGYFKPIILFPIGLINGLSSEEVEAILIHELSHIKRKDYLINILQSVVEVVYFFNPFILLLSRLIREEREHASDERAISMGIPRRTYVEILANLYEHALASNKFSLTIATKNKLTLKRIRRIMKTHSNNNNKLITSLIVVIAVSFVLYIGAESHAPVNSIENYSPGRIAVAGPISSTRFEKPDKIINQLVTNLKKETSSIESIIPVDTIDQKELERIEREYEKAKEKLHSTREWQEMAAIKQEMFKEQMEYVKEISPQIEEAMKAVKINIEELGLEELREQMADIEVELREAELSEKVQLALEHSAQIMHESMAEVKAEIAKIKFEELEAIAEIHAMEAASYALEAKEIAKEAEVMAAEAKKVTVKVEAFLDELKPILVKDGYIKSINDLDELRFDDGKVWVNEKEVKAKEAKRYYELRKKHLGEDSDFFMN